MKNTLNKKNIWALVISLLIAQGAGLLGSLFTFSAIPTWYASLVKPAINPPNWLFGPVWTTLYMLMGLAAWMVWQKMDPRVRKDDKAEGKDIKVGLFIYGLQLILNILWSIIFFGLHEPGLALIEIIVFWLSILVCMIYFYKTSRAAAWLLLPYILWVSFATYLNFELWRLNTATSHPPVACTMEAKLCPDGSAVGRTGPNCEFAPCP